MAHIGLPGTQGFLTGCFPQKGYTCKGTERKEGKPLPGTAMLQTGGPQKNVRMFWTAAGVMGEFTHHGKVEVRRVGEVLGSAA